MPPMVPLGPEPTQETESRSCTRVEGTQLELEAEKEDVRTEAEAQGEESGSFALELGQESQTRKARAWRTPEQPEAQAGFETCPHLDCETQSREASMCVKPLAGFGVLFPAAIQD